MVIQRDQTKKNQHNIPNVSLASYCCLNLLFRNYAPTVSLLKIPSFFFIFSSFTQFINNIKVGYWFIAKVFLLTAPFCMAFVVHPLEVPFLANPIYLKPLPDKLPHTGAANDPRAPNNKVEIHHLGFVFW